MRQEPNDKKSRYGMSDAADIDRDVEPAEFPDNDQIFADLKQLVTNGISASARTATLTITYSDGCSLTWSFDFKAE
jgi:hypothetical protein